MNALIGDGLIDQAIEHLQECLNSQNKHDLLQSLILIKSSYSQLGEQVTRGQIAFEEQTRRTNSIAGRLLDLMTDTEEVIGDGVQQDVRAIPPAIYISSGTPFNPDQARMIDSIKSKLVELNVDVERWRDTFLNILPGLTTVREKMREVDGCVIIAFEQLHVQQGVFKPGGNEEQNVEDLSLTSPWIHMEAAMAYQLDLPLLIFKDPKLKTRGVLNNANHQWLIVEVDPSKPGDIDSGRIVPLMQSWIMEVQKFRSSRHG